MADTKDLSDVFAEFEGKKEEKKEEKEKSPEPPKKEEETTEKEEETPPKEAPKEEKTPERHRNFAIECNNRAWDLCVQVRTAAEDEELLNAAHAAAFHWGHAGNERNHMRATMLLAEAHALLGLGPTALAYANRMKGYFLQQSDTYRHGFLVLSN